MILNDEAGWQLAQNQRECTPIQRFVYILAKHEHTPDPEDPTGANKGTEVIQGWK